MSGTAVQFLCDIHFRHLSGITFYISLLQVRIVCSGGEHELVTSNWYEGEEKMGFIMRSSLVSAASHSSF
jgi:hypothetical protein